MSKLVLGRAFGVLAPATVALTLALAGCGGSSNDASSTSGGKKKTDGKPLALTYANISSDGEVFVEINNNVKDSAAKLGYKLKIYDNNLNASTTLNNAQLMVANRPKVILEFNGIDSVSGAVERVFQRSGIPCISVNTPGTGKCHWFNLDNKGLGSGVAEVVGRAAQKRGWTGANTSVVLLDDAPGGVQVNSSVGFFYDTLQDLVTGLSPISGAAAITPSTTRIGSTTIQASGGQTLASSYTAMANVLGSIPKSRNIILFTVSDDSTLGALRAFRRAGRSGGILTSGTGGSSAGLQQLRSNPDWVAEGDAFISNWGQYLMAMAKAVADGTDTPYLTTSPLAVLTKDVTLAKANVFPVGNYFRKGSTTPYKLPPLQPVAKHLLIPFGIKPAGNDYLADTGVLQKFGNVSGLK